LKFTDGVWQSSKGVRIYQAAQARDWQFEEKSLTLYASTEHLIGRGVVDNIPQIAVRVSAPLPGVVRVQLTHFKGTRACGPSFQIAENDTPPETSEDANTLVLRSGKLEARIEKLPWRISFLYDGRPLTESACGNLAYVLTEDDGPFVRVAPDTSRARAA
jgi:alpha-D-xyloside xylohydrolase